MQVADKRNLVFCYVFEVKKLGFFLAGQNVFTSVGTTRGQGIIRVVVVATFFLTFSFLEDFKSK